MGDKMSASTNALNWFEIPVIDAERAQDFYEHIFQITMHPMEIMGMKMVMFPPSGENGTVGGALVKGDMHIPSLTGCLVYLNANPDLQLVLNHVPSAGGKIKLPKTEIGEGNGFMAFFEDTEGNMVGLHSNS
jgi:predicted enzyme related to lactoylglutathione lyase